MTSRCADVIKTFLLSSPTGSAAHRIPLSTVHNMKRLLKKFDKYKKQKHPSLTSADTSGSSPEPATSTSTSTIATPTVGLMPSVPDRTEILGQQVVQATSVTVSVQISPSHP